MSDIYQVENGKYEGWEVPDYIYNEENWELGFHITQDEQRIEICNMKDSHLLNTIKYFKGYNTKPLLKEAKKRNLI